MAVSKFRLVNFALSAPLILLLAGPSRADEIADAYQRLEQNPADVVLNLQYAAAAEKGGKLKWALPAYERALMADPRNIEAKEGIDRVTHKIRAEAEASKSTTVCRYESVLPRIDRLVLHPVRHSLLPA